MTLNVARRPLLAGLALAMLGGAARGADMEDEKTPYGLVGRMKAQPGKGDALVAILTKGVGGMPGCIAYLVAQQADDRDLIWITEFWESKADHAASLQFPAVREAIAQGRPLIAGFELSVETIPAVEPVTAA